MCMNDKLCFPEMDSSCGFWKAGMIFKAPALALKPADARCYHIYIRKREAIIFGTRKVYQVRLIVFSGIHSRWMP